MILRVCRSLLPPRIHKNAIARKFWKRKIRSSAVNNATGISEAKSMEIIQLRVLAIITLLTGDECLGHQTSLWKLVANFT